MRGSSSVANIVAGCLEQLQELRTPDDLMEFVHGDLAVRVGSFNQVDTPDRAAADSSSIIGMFLRQCTINFDSLSFEVSSNAPDAASQSRSTPSIMSISSERCAALTAPPWR